jgi:hypothetical protein
MQTVHAIPPAAGAAAALRDYAAYQQAESALRALYFGRPLDTEILVNRPSTELVQRHSAVVEELARNIAAGEVAQPRAALKQLLHASGFLSHAISERPTV